MLIKGVFRSFPMRTTQMELFSARRMETWTLCDCSFPMQTFSSVHMLYPSFHRRNLGVKRPEEKYNELKVSISKSFDEAFNSHPRHNVQLEVTTLMQTWYIFWFTCRHSQWLIDFIVVRNMVFSSTRFQQIDIHKAIWLSKYQRSRNLVYKILEP